MSDTDSTRRKLIELLQADEPATSGASVPKHVASQVTPPGMSRKEYRKRLRERDARLRKYGLL